jgi:hypothetical protein
LIKCVKHIMRCKSQTVKLSGYAAKVKTKCDEKILSQHFRQKIFETRALRFFKKFLGVVLLFDFAVVHK